MVLPAIGIIGSDSKLEFYIECFLLNNFEIKWIYDSENTQYSINIAKKYQIKLVSDEFLLLILSENVDLFFLIGDPSYFHYYSKQLSNQGKHIIFANLLGNSLLDCQEIVVMYKKCIKSLLYVLNPLRYTPVFQSLKNYISYNSIGKILLIDCNIRISTLFKSTLDDWMMDRNTGGGILSNIVSLYVDLLHFIFNFKISNVSSTIKTLVTLPFIDFPYMKV